MVVKANMKINLNFPELKLDKELMKIAKRVVIADIEARMDEGVDLNNKVYDENAKSTIKYKSKRELRTEPLLATGQLRRSFKAKSNKGNVVIIRPSGKRRSWFGERVLANSELVDILQNKGVDSKRGKIFFEFFGISDDAEKNAISWMNSYINKEIRLGRRKTVR